VSIFIILNFIYKDKKISKEVFVSLIAFIGFVSIVAYFNINLNIFGLNLTNYFERYSSIFSYFTGQKYSNPLYSDSGHFEESILLSKLFLNNWYKMFWGFGIGQQVGIISEATGGFAPHNTYVYAWIYFGLFMTFYLLYFTIYFFLKIIKNILLKDKEKFYSCYITSFSFLIFIILISGWATSQVKFIMTNLLFTSQFVLLLTITTITETNFKLIKENF
jgi:hypothetical protein